MSGAWIGDERHGRIGRCLAATLSTVRSPEEGNGQPHRWPLGGSGPLGFPYGDPPSGNRGLPFGSAEFLELVHALDLVLPSLKGTSSRWFPPRFRWRGSGHLGTTRASRAHGRLSLRTRSAAHKSSLRRPLPDAPLMVRFATRNEASRGTARSSSGDASSTVP